jgi:hypothetical protein
MKKSLFLLLGIILVATSCKNHLSKKNASKQITASKHYPKITDYEFTKAFSKDDNTEGFGINVIIEDDESKEVKKMIEIFEKNKLIRFEETPHREETDQGFLGTTVKTWIDVKISLTDEGKKYLEEENKDSYKVRLWETGINAISDITEWKSGGATVYYSISNKNITPFGKCFSNNSQTIQKKINFSNGKHSWEIIDIDTELEY